MMTRRNSLAKFRTGALLLVASAFGTCIQVWGAMSRWSWRGYPDEEALRKHLRYSDNHPHIKPEHIKLMTFKQCIAFHEWDHHIRRKNRGRWSTARQVSGTTSNEPYKTPTAGKFKLPKLPGEAEAQIIEGESSKQDGTIYSYDGLYDGKRSDTKAE